MDYQTVLYEIENTLKDLNLGGKVPDYIPELASVSPKKLGMHLRLLNGDNYSFGDNEEIFSIQSISKVFTLTLARKCVGTGIWERVNVEPSGNAYNSLSELERENGIPRNPFINSGALVIADILLSHFKDPKAELLKFVHHLTGDKTIGYNQSVSSSEEEHGFRNTALVNYMKALGNIENDPEEILDFYYNQCALTMSCRQLANAFTIFANGGRLLSTGEEIIEAQEAKRINAIMQTCGFYDEAGEFSYRVGLPGKSGVGGGIVAVHPGLYTVAVWSPPLNKKGNSTKGMKALEAFTYITNSSIF